MTLNTITRAMKSVAPFVPLALALSIFAASEPQTPNNGSSTTGKPAASGKTSSTSSTSSGTVQGNGILQNSNNIGAPSSSSGATGSTPSGGMPTGTANTGPALSVKLVLVAYPIDPSGNARGTMKVAMSGTPAAAAGTMSSSFEPQGTSAVTGTQSGKLTGKLSTAKGKLSGTLKGKIDLNVTVAKPTRLVLSLQINATKMPASAVTQAIINALHVNAYYGETIADSPVTIAEKIPLEDENGQPSFEFVKSKMLAYLNVAVTESFQQCAADPVFLAPFDRCDKLNHRWFVCQASTPSSAAQQSSTPGVSVNATAPTTVTVVTATLPSATPSTPNGTGGATTSGASPTTAGAGTTTTSTTTSGSATSGGGTPAAGGTQPPAGTSPATPGSGPTPGQPATGQTPAAPAEYVRIRKQGAGYTLLAQNVSPYRLSQALMFMDKNVKPYAIENGEFAGGTVTTSFPVYGEGTDGSAFVRISNQVAQLALTAGTEDKIPAVWPVTFVPNALPAPGSAGTAVSAPASPSSTDAFMTGLQTALKIFDSSGAVTYSNVGNRLLLDGPRSKVELDRRALAQWLDIPYSQVRIDFYTFQATASSTRDKVTWVNGYPQKKPGEIEEKQEMRTLERGIQMSRILQSLLSQNLLKAVEGSTALDPTWDPASGHSKLSFFTGISTEDPKMPRPVAPYVHNPAQLLKLVGFDPSPHRELTMPEALVFISFMNGADQAAVLMNALKNSLKAFDNNVRSTLLDGPHLGSPAIGNGTDTFLQRLNEILPQAPTVKELKAFGLTQDDYDSIRTLLKSQIAKNPNDTLPQLMSKLSGLVDPSALPDLMDKALKLAQLVLNSERNDLDPVGRDLERGTSWRGDGTKELAEANEALFMGLEVRETLASAVGSQELRTTLADSPNSVKVNLLQEVDNTRHCIDRLFARINEVVGLLARSDVRSLKMANTKFPGQTGSVPLTKLFWKMELALHNFIEESPYSLLAEENVADPNSKVDSLVSQRQAIEFLKYWYICNNLDEIKGSLASDGLYQSRAVKFLTQDPTKSLLQDPQGNASTSINLPASGSVTINTQSYYSARVVLQGTWTGTVAAALSSDGGITYTPTDFVDPATPEPVASATSNGDYSIQLPGGTTNVKLTFTQSTGTLAGYLQANSAADPQVFGGAIMSEPELKHIVSTEDIPGKLTQTSSSADVALKNAMDALRVDLQSICVDPLVEWATTTISEDTNNTAVSLVGTNSITVTSGQSAQQNTTVQTYLPYAAQTQASDVANSLTSNSSLISSLAGGTVAQLALAAILAQPATVYNLFAPGVSLSVLPSVEKDGRAARLQLSMVAGVTPGSAGTATTGGGPANNTPATAHYDFTTNQSITTDVNVYALDMFEISTSDLQTTGPGEPQWRVPFLEWLPIIGKYFYGPPKHEVKDYDTIILARVTILPRSLDLAGNFLN